MVTRVHLTQMSHFKQESECSHTYWSLVIELSMQESMRTGSCTQLEAMKENLITGVMRDHLSAWQVTRSNYLAFQFRMDMQNRKKSVSQPCKAVWMRATAILRGNQGPLAKASPSFCWNLVYLLDTMDLFISKTCWVNGCLSLPPCVCLSL